MRNESTRVCTFIVVRMGAGYQPFVREKWHKLRTLFGPEFGPNSLDKLRTLKFLTSAADQ